MRGLERKRDDRTEVIRLKRAGIRDIEAIEEMKQSTYAVIFGGKEELDSKLLFDNNEFYLIKNKEIAIGIVGVVVDENQYRIENFLVKKEYQDKEFENNIINHIQSMYPEANEWYFNHSFIVE